MIEPIYTYAALGGTVGFIAGACVCRMMLYTAERLLRKANQRLQTARQMNQRSVEFYQEAMKRDQRILTLLQRLQLAGAKHDQAGHG